MRRLLPILFALGLMVAATRLLPAAHGSGGFTPPPTVPPFGASWVRSGSNPILSPVAAWETTAVIEAHVLHDTTWRMWYRGGWSTQAIGYATSTDGVSWTKYVSNPVYGQGGSGQAADVALPSVTKVGTTLYLFAVTSPFVGGNAPIVATSSDGIAWTTQTSSMALPSGATLWGNNTVWQEGGTWFRLQEAGPSPWKIYLYTSTDGLTWTISNSGAALSSLQVAAGGMYGGPAFATDVNGFATPTFAGTYHLWYHAAGVSGNLPTDIYHATSSDKINWTISPGTPVLTHTAATFEVDQVETPSVIVIGGTAYLFYGGDDNAGSAAKIGVATAPATP